MLLLALCCCPKLGRKRKREFNCGLDLSMSKDFIDLFLLGSSLFALTMRVENRSRWAPLVFHVKRGGMDGETIMEKEILPGAHIDLIPSTIFGNDNKDHPVFAYVHIDGMDAQLWTPIDPSMIKYNAKVFLGFVEFRRPIETAFFGGSKLGRLRVVVEVKNAAKKMMDKVMGRN